MAEAITSNLKYMAQAVSTQSILDVFVLQDVIDQEDADTLRGMFKTNRELENFLVKNNLVTRDSINKAYGILLKLPYIELTNVQIPDEAKKVFPEGLARKFGAIAFAYEENLLRLAVSRPADMLVGFKTGAWDFFEKKGIGLEIFITGESDFIEAIKQYRPIKAKKTLLKKGSLPVVYLRNQSIEDKYLKKLPADFIKKNRLVVIGQNSAGEFLMATEKPDDPNTIKIIESLRKDNGIKAELFATSGDDIDYVLDKLSKVQKGVGADEKMDKAEKMGNDFTVDEVEPVNEAKSENISPVKKEKKESMSLKDMVKDMLGVKEEGDITIDEMGSVGKKAETVASPSLVKIDPEQEKIRRNISEGIKVGEKDSLKSAGIRLDNIDTKDELLAQNSKNSKSDKEKTSPVDKSEKPVEAVPTEEDPNSKSEPMANPEPEQPTEETKNEETENKVETVVEETASNAPKMVDTEAEARDASGLKNEDLGSLVKDDIKDEKMLAEACKGGYIPKIVASVVNYALTNRSSDIHVEPMAKVLRIRCRVDGIMTEILNLPLSFHPPFVSRIKILSKLKIDETRIPQDGRFDVIFNKREVDVRVSTLPTVHGEKVVMRILDKSQGILSLEDLGVMGTAKEDTIAAIGKPYGIILATGPTGSGKSTTLYAILNRISVPGVNVITLEDPVEYEIQGINQCQVKPEIGFTFATGLRSVLRQDPNIIMVGEIRDAETANMATHAALTGHLVLSTLHTNDTAGALPRLINMGIEPFLITSAINLIIAQRLVRRICPKCKEEMKIPDKLMVQLKAEIDKISPNNAKDRERFPKEWKLYYGKGCSECNKGFKGRVGIYEVMKITPKIEELAIEKRPANEIKEQSIKDGMLTMKQDGILKAFAGETSIDEIYQAIVDSKSEEVPSMEVDTTPPPEA